VNSDAILKIAAFVVPLTQLVKWAGLPDRRAPLAVLVLALAGVAFWGWSAGSFSRETAFSYAEGWLAVALSAAGGFGFTRSLPSSLTATKEPPPGAGADPSGKM